MKVIEPEMESAESWAGKVRLAYIGAPKNPPWSFPNVIRRAQADALREAVKIIRGVLCGSHDTIPTFRDNVMRRIEARAAAVVKGVLWSDRVKIGPAPTKPEEEGA